MKPDLMDGFSKPVLFQEALAESEDVLSILCIFFAGKSRLPPSLLAPDANMEVLYWLVMPAELQGQLLGHLHETGL